MSEQKPRLEELQENAVRYFCDRPSNFPAGRPYNCCESVLMAIAKPLGVDSAHPEDRHSHWCWSQSQWASLRLDLKHNDTDWR